MMWIFKRDTSKIGLQVFEFNGLHLFLFAEKRKDSEILYYFSAWEKKNSRVKTTLMS